MAAFHQYLVAVQIPASAIAVGVEVDRLHLKEIIAEGLDIPVDEKNFDVYIKRAPRHCDLERERQ